MTSRRTVLRSLATLPLLGACAGTDVKSRRHYTPSGLPLRRVDVSADRVIRSVAGLRPFRRTGYVVRAEPFDAKTLIHNYGHGGGGITLSWGTAHRAIRLAPRTAEDRAAVIGCGAIGLATARLLQRYGWQVTIYAKDLPPETTSDIAGAQWSPASFYDDDAVDDAFYARVGTDLRHSYREFQQLTGARYGIRWMSNYVLTERAVRTDDMRFRYPDLFPELLRLSTGEHPFNARHVLHFDTMFIEPPVYLPALMRDVRDAGGHIVVREFGDRDAVLALGEPVIFNCTGLGAKALFGDEELMPVRGQLVFLKPQPDIHYLMISNGIYMFPRTDGVLLGGTFERNEWSLTPDEGTTVRLLEQHRHLFRAMDDPWALPWS